MFPKIGAISLLVFLATFSILDTFLICGNNCNLSQKTGKYVKLNVKVADDERLFLYKGLSPWTPQMTVSLAMRILAHENPTAFNFTTKFYSPYGDFVSSINGVTPDVGRYWKLCVNDRPAVCGVDTYRLSEADDVLWKLANVKENPNEDGKC